jgi:hypothetical protein
MTSSFTTNKDIEKPGNGDYVDVWNVPLNGDMTVVDYALGTAQSFNATAGSQTLGSYDHSTKALATYSYVPLIINVTGAISANVTYTIPSGVGGQWIVYNTTTDATGGPWTVTFVSGGGGTNYTVTRNAPITIYCDGTNVRSVASPSPIPSGTNMLFYQAAAPTGWTQLTSVNDYSVRIVSGTGGITNGGIGVSTMFSGSYSVGATAITAAQMPSHTHGVNDPGHTHGGMNAAAFPDTFNSTPYVPNNANFDTPYNWSAVTGISIQSAGGGQSHTHTIPNLQYADVIICTKN